jgi:hypothetical protein
MVCPKNGSPYRCLVTGGGRNPTHLPGESWSLLKGGLQSIDPNMYKADHEYPTARFADRTPVFRLPCCRIHAKPSANLTVYWAGWAHSRIIGRRNKKGTSQRRSYDSGVSSHFSGPPGRRPGRKRARQRARLEARPNKLKLQTLIRLYAIEFAFLIL